MILREFLYVDTDKVRSIMAQLDEGIDEGETSTQSSEKKTSLGSVRLARHERGVGEETVTQRSLLDAIFPKFEEALESEGLLSDISEELQTPGYWPNELRSSYPPGSIVRITAPARLFDARYVAAIMAGVSAAVNGFTTFTGTTHDGANQNRAEKRSAARTTPHKQPTTGPAPAESLELEDRIMNFPNNSIEGLTTDMLKAFIRLARGMFIPGLHLMLSPASLDSHIITCRLQEGMKYLESDPEVLFARYGVTDQLWTMVGTVGAYAPEDSTPFDTAATQKDWGRPQFIDMVNTFMRHIGSSGLADMPTFPGFSMIPFAVYRLIGSPVEGAH